MQSVSGFLRSSRFHVPCPSSTPYEDNMRASFCSTRATSKYIGIPVLVSGLPQASTAWEREQAKRKAAAAASVSGNDAKVKVRACPGHELLPARAKKHYQAPHLSAFD